jgi:hypothetical protein
MGSLEEISEGDSDDEPQTPLRRKSRIEVEYEDSANQSVNILH